MAKERGEMMKKLSVLLLVIVMCLALTACGKKANDEITNSGASMSWQEQYDLGIRLLNEGKYEEAILVFQAMIQIDPKRSEGYQKLADAYVAVGDYEKAASVLMDGFQATGVASLEHQLKDVQNMIEEWKNQQQQQGQQTNETLPSEQLSSPSEAPELPEVLKPQDKDGLTQIIYEEEEYVVFDEKTMDLWAAAIEAGVNDDKEGLCTALDAMDLEALKAVSTVQDLEYAYSVTGWTLWQGDLLGYAYYTTPEGNVSWSMEYRPQDGMGFSLAWGRRPDGANRSFYRGEISQWLFAGDYQGINEEIYQGESVYTSVTNGTASQELLHGDVIHRQESAGAPVIMLYYHYENGIRQDVWVDPDDGESYPAKRVEMYPDGTESVAYMMFGEPEGLVIVNYVMGSVYVVQE